MRFDRDARRRWVDRIMRFAAFGCVLLALVPLGSVIYQAAVRGAAAFSVAFFTQNEPPACGVAATNCVAGGVANAIEGTLIMVGVAALIALPLGILTGIYLAEYGKNRFGRTARFLVDVLSGVPSIVIGVFVFSLFLVLANDSLLSLSYVRSATSGAVALAVIMVPLIARTSDEALRLVPTATREAALALGIPRYRTILRIVLSTGRAGVVTGALLASARAAGESAPLLMTASGSFFGFSGFNQVSAALPLVIYNYGLQPYANYQALAWGSALLLIAIMLGISIAARFALRSTLRGRSP